MLVLRRNALPILIGATALLMAVASLVVIVDHWPWRHGGPFESAMMRGYDRRAFDMRDRSDRPLRMPGDSNAAPGSARPVPQQSLLGVSVQTSMGGVRVDAVQADSPASHAGVQSGDVITKVNGADVPSTTALRDLLAKIAPGAQYDLVVRRGTNEQTLRVTAPADMSTPAASSTKPGA